MSRIHSTLAAAVVALSATALSVTALSAQIYPLTNGPDGTGTNTIDSARGFTGSNAVAPERELLYHPERAGNAAASLGIHAAPPGAVEADLAAHDRGFRGDDRPRAGRRRQQAFDR